MSCKIGKLLLEQRGEPMWEASAIAGSLAGKKKFRS